MELKTAIEILEYHQEWRLGKREDMIHEPKKITEALDILLSQVKNLFINNIVWQTEQLEALEDLKQWCFENCQPFEEERLHEILKRL